MILRPVQRELRGVKTPWWKIALRTIGVLVLIPALTITPSPAVATFAVPAPTVVRGAVTLTPAAVVATFVVPTPSVVTPGAGAVDHSIWWNRNTANWWA